MYDIKWIREHPDAFDRGLKRRGLEPLSAKLLALDEKRRAAITKSEAGAGAAQCGVEGNRRGQGQEGRGRRAKADGRGRTSSRPPCRRWRTSRRNSATKLDKELAQIPNMPLDEVPDGKDEHGNVEHHQSGKKRDYAFKPKQHFELGEALGMMDFELAAKLSGARFVVLQKGLARLERALGQFMLDLHTSEKHWLHRSQSAVAGARRGDVWNGAVAEV